MNVRKSNGFSGCLVVVAVILVAFFCPLRGQSQQTVLGTPNYWRGIRVNSGYNAICCEVRGIQRHWRLKDWERRNHR